MAELIDPTQAGEYQVILGETLTSDNSNRLFTGFNYNHKPVLSTTFAPSQARLKPSLPGQTSSYDLSFTDNEGQYAFSGARNTDKGQYVLWFDSTRQVLVLDRIDSTFNMNITRMPGNSDADTLGRRYPHLDSDTGRSSGSSSSSSSRPLAAGRAKSPPAARKPQARKPEKKQFAHKSEKKAPPKNLALPTPTPNSQKQQQSESKEKKSRRGAEPEDEEHDDDDDDDDDGFQIEYPGGEPRSKTTAFSPAFASVRRFDEFMDQRESEADDADEESDGESGDDFKLPSPVNHNGQPVQAQQSAGEAMEVDEEEEKGEEKDDVGDAFETQIEDDDLEDDLEKEMEMAFEAAANGGQHEAVEAGDESEISEED